MMISLIVAAIYVIPGGYIYAMTNQQITVNLMVELIVGYMLPGNPVGNMVRNRTKAIEFYVH